MNSDRTSTIVTTSNNNNNNNNKRRRVSGEGPVSADGGANQPPEAVVSAVQSSAAAADRNNAYVNFDEEANNIESFAYLLKMKAMFLQFEDYMMNLRQTGTFNGQYLLDIFNQVMGINNSNYQLFIDEVNFNILLDAQGGGKHGISAGSSSRRAPNLTHFVQCLEQVFEEKTEASMAKAESYLVRILPRREQQQQPQFVARNNNNTNTNTNNNYIDVGWAVSYWRFTHEVVSPVTWEKIPELLLVKMQKENEEEVTDAINNLAKLVSTENANHHEHLDEALKLGAHSITIGKMRKYPFNGKVQNAGCFIICRLTRSRLFRGTIVKAGGMEAVYNAMKIFSNSSYIQGSGLASCCNLFISIDESDVVKKASERFVNDLGGIQFAVARMKKFPEDSNLIYSCCGLFACLAQEQAFHGPMRAAGVVGVVGNAVDKFFNNHEIKQSAAIFMKRMLP